MSQNVKQKQFWIHSTKVTCVHSSRSWTVFNLIIFLPLDYQPMPMQSHSKYDETKNNGKTIPWTTGQLARGQKYK